MKQMFDRKAVEVFSIISLKTYVGDSIFLKFWGHPTAALRTMSSDTNFLYESPQVIFYLRFLNQYLIFAVK